MEFKTPLERSNKVQVPKTIRWQFKLEPDQVFHVTMSRLEGGWESFYAKMGKDGRIYLPKTVIFAVYGKETPQASS